MENNQNIFNFNHTIYIYIYIYTWWQNDGKLHETGRVITTECRIDFLVTLVITNTPLAKLLKISHYTLKIEPKGTKRIHELVYFCYLHFNRTDVEIYLEN